MGQGGVVRRSGWVRGSGEEDQEPSEGSGVRTDEG